MKLRLLQKKNIFLPTWQGWILLLLFISLFIYLFLRTVYRFLSPDYPVDSKVMVVEGFVPDYVLDSASEIFQGTECSLMITSGVPLMTGQILSGYKSFAEIARETMLHKGFDSALVVAVPSREVKKDRTYASAISVRDWLKMNRPEVHSFNILTLGPHARRSWLIYQKVFGDDFSIGIRSVPDIAYEPRYWYRASEGVRNVMPEWIAYIYFKFFFIPGESDNIKK